MSKKVESRKIKITQDDMQKGHAKLGPKEKVLSTLVKDQSNVRTVVLDSKTTKLIYPGQKDYNTPIDVLRSRWEQSKLESLNTIKIKK